MELIALFIFAGSLSYIALRSEFIPLKMAAGFSWFAVWMYVKGSPPSPLVEGSAAHTALLLVLIFAGAAMLLSAFGSNVGRQRNYEGGGGFLNVSNWKWRFGRDKDEVEGRRPNHPETEDEYRLRVRRALHRK